MPRSFMTVRNKYYSTANDSEKRSTDFYQFNPIDGTIIWDAPGRQVNITLPSLLRNGVKWSGIWLTRAMLSVTCRSSLTGIAQTSDLNCRSLRILCWSGQVDTCFYFEQILTMIVVKIEAFAQILNQDLSHPFPFPATYTPLPTEDDSERNSGKAFSGNSVL